MRQRRPQATDRVPKTIIRTLKRLILRARLVIALRGIGAVVSLAIAVVLVLMAADAAVTIFSSGVRYALTLSGLGVAVAGVVWLLIRPLARTLTLAGVARAIEYHHPELQERISSAVELLSSRDAPELRGSEALIAALAEKASGDVRTIRPRREISFRRAWAALFLALGLAAVLGGLFLAWPAKTSRLLLRAAAPYMNLPNVSADDLTVAPGDVVITRGRFLRVDVEVASQAVRRAHLRMPAPDGTETVELMTRVFDPEHEAARFTFTCPSAEDSFRYRIHAGDALSRYYTVTVVPFPAVTRIDLRYDYPEYTQLEPRFERDATGDIAAVAGTTVTVTARTNTAVRSGELVIDGQPAPAASAELVAAAGGTTDCVFRVQLEPGLAGRWKAKFTDRYGFANTPGEHDIEALPDAPPRVQVLEPEQKRLRMAPEDQLPLGGRVSRHRLLLPHRHTVDI